MGFVRTLSVSWKVRRRFTAALIALDSLPNKNSSLVVYYLFLSICWLSLFVGPVFLIDFSKMWLWIVRHHICPTFLVCLQSMRFFHVLPLLVDVWVHCTLSADRLCSFLEILFSPGNFWIYQILCIILSNYYTHAAIIGCDSWILSISSKIWSFGFSWCSLIPYFSSWFRTYLLALYSSTTIKGTGWTTHRLIQLGWLVCSMVQDILIWI